MHGNQHTISPQTRTYNQACMVLCFEFETKTVLVTRAEQCSHSTQPFHSSDRSPHKQAGGG